MTGTWDCAAIISGTEEAVTGSKGSFPKTLWATGTPSMYWTPFRVTRFIFGRAGMKARRSAPAASSAAVSSAPMLPRRAESVFL